MTKRRYTEEQFRTAIADEAVRTMADLCRALGIVPRGANYETVRDYAQRQGVDLADHLRSRTHRFGRSEADVAAAVADNKSMAAAIRQLGERPHTGTYKRLRQEVARLDLPTDHWTGQGWCLGRKFPERKRPIDDYLVSGRLVASAKLRARLIEDGVKEHRCEACGMSEWHGRPIPLELDHINGDRTDNRLVNLRLICPNCHAFTSTYRGRNIGRYT